MLFLIQDHEQLPKDPIEIPDDVEEYDVNLDVLLINPQNLNSNMMSNEYVKVSNEEEIKMSIVCFT